MLTTEQLQEIDARLRRGDLPEEIAKDMGLSSASFRYQLLKSGKQIAIFRRLEATGSMASPMNEMARPVTQSEDLALTR